MLNALLDLLRPAAASVASPASEESINQVDTTFDPTRLHPSRTRMNRIEPEAQVFVLTYRGSNKAIRYVELHGSLKKQFGPQIKLWTVPTEGTRDDDLIRDAVVDGRSLLHALRNPVEVPVIPECFHPDEWTPPAKIDWNAGAIKAVDAAPKAASPVLQPAPQPTAAATPVAAPNVAPELGAPLAIFEGRYMTSGFMPWVGGDGKVGGPKFAVLLSRSGDDKEQRVYGSDLSRVIAEDSPQPGDLVRLTKYPLTPIQVGDRVVRKNIWHLTKLREAANA